jgi:hypothetical protein
MTLPDELQGVVPRRVALTLRGKASVFFFFTLATAGIISGALLYVQADRDAILHAQHVSESVSATGEILTAEFVSGKHGRWGHDL